jgi:hypothetical protein
MNLRSMLLDTICVTWSHGLNSGPLEYGIHRKIIQIPDLGYTFEMLDVSGLESVFAPDFGGLYMGMENFPTA